MEKRQEYKGDDIIVCPRCGSDDVDFDEAPDNARCQACQQPFKLRTVVIWDA